MEKFEVIRGIFDLVTLNGIQKTGAIGFYTDGKVEYGYLKYLEINPIIESAKEVTIISQEHDFSDICDASLRVVIDERAVPASELSYRILKTIYDNLSYSYSPTLEEKNYIELCRTIRLQPNSGLGVTVSRSALDFILFGYKEKVLKEIWHSRGIEEGYIR